MVYQLVVARKAQKDLSKLDNVYRSRATVALAVLSNDPYRGKKLKGDHKKEFAYRVWPYRIIYRVKEKERVVLIIRIGHRQSVY